MPYNPLLGPQWMPFHTEMLNSSLAVCMQMLTCEGVPCCSICNALIEGRCASFTRFSMAHNRMIIGVSECQVFKHIIIWSQWRCWCIAVEYWAHRHKRKTNCHLLFTLTFEDNALQFYIRNIFVWWWFMVVYTHIFSGIAKIVVVVVYICINIGNSKICTNVSHKIPFSYMKCFSRMTFASI